MGGVFGIGMQIDWRATGLTFLRLTTQTELPQDCLQRVRRASVPDEEGDSCFWEQFKGYHGLAIVAPEASQDDASEQTQGETTVALAFLYQRGTGEKPESVGGMPKIGSLIDILSSYALESAIACSARFVYPKRIKPKPVVKLPLECLQSPDMPFDSIHGVRLVKHEGKAVKYNAVVDLDHGELMATIGYRTGGPIDAGLLGRAAAVAAEISAKLVTVSK